MDFKSLLCTRQDYRKERDDKLRLIVKNLSASFKAHKIVESEELLNYLQEYPNEDVNRTFSIGGYPINILHLAVMANDINICVDLLRKGAIPTSINVSMACRRGYIDIVELLIRNYKEPNESDIALWEQTSLSNGYKNIAYLIDRLLKGIFIQFTKSNTDYFIRIINATLKYTPENAYMDKSQGCRPIKVILHEMSEQLVKYGYMSYTTEYLYALKKVINDSFSICKLFHLGAEDLINSAISYYTTYNQGIMETDQRTLTGALLVVIS